MMPTAFRPFAFHTTAELHTMYRRGQSFWIAIEISFELATRTDAMWQRLGGTVREPLTVALLPRWRMP